MKKKIYLSIGTAIATATPIAAVIACEPWDKPDIKDAYDLTGLDEKGWHSIFHVGGRSLPAKDTKFKVTANGNTYEYTWVEEDDNADVPSSYKNGAGSQNDVINYLTRKLGGEKASDSDLEGIIGAFGISQHGIKFDPNVKTTSSASAASDEIVPFRTNHKFAEGLTVTGKTMDLTNKTISDIQNDPNEYFLSGNLRNYPPAGLVFKITNNKKEYTYTWKREDVINKYSYHYTLKNFHFDTLLKYIVKRMVQNDKTFTTEESVAKKVEEIFKQIKEVKQAKEVSTKVDNF